MNKTVVRSAGSQFGIIEYELIRKRVKNINLRVRRDGSVCVSAPASVPAGYLDSFVGSKARKIISARERISEGKSGRSEEGGITVFGRDTLIRWKLKTHGGPDYELLPDEGVLLVSVPAGADSGRREILLDAALRDLCEKSVLDCAREIWPYFEGKVREFPEIRFRKMTSQWGNCRPSAGRLTFSTALVRAPRDCIELVVAHEFNHFLHPDHSAAFYSDLAALIPDWKERRKKIRAFAEK